MKDVMFDFEKWIDFYLSENDFKEIYDFYEAIEMRTSTTHFEFTERPVKDGTQFIIKSWGDTILILKSEKQLNAILEYVRVNYMDEMDKESYWGLKSLQEKDES